MGAGSQSRCNRLLPGVGFRNRSRHKCVHCVRTGMKSVMPAPFRPARTDLPTLRWPLLNKQT